MRNPPANRPQAAQTDAIRRLIDQGNLPEAEKRLQLLRTRFPDFKPLYGLAFELAQASSNRLLMLVEAWEWAQASPNSVAAWSALADSTGAGSMALHLAALKRLAEFEGVPASGLPPLDPHPFGDLPPDEVRQLELGSALLAVQRFDQAEQVFARIDHPVSRNNLALAHFACGRIELARDEWEASWRAVPDNLFALERAVTAHLWLGGREAAAPFEAALASATALRPEDAYAQLAALAVLGRIDEAEAVYRANAEREWWGENPVAAWFHHTGAYVAWRRDDKRSLFHRLDAAHTAVPDFEPTEEAGRTALKGVLDKETPSWAIGDVSAWWPLANMLALSRSGARTDSEVVAALGIRPPHPDYLVLMVTHGGKVGRSLALAVLQGLTEGGDAAAVDALKRLLRLPCGPDSVRSSIHGWLLEHGHLASDESVELYSLGELRTVKALKVKIHSEVSEDRELPPEGAEEYERAFNLAADGHLAGALAVFESLHRAHPDSARLMTALANIKRALNHPLSEIEPLVQKAWETDQNYLFARTAMACLLADKGEPGAARELLAPLMDREAFHYSEWRSYLGAQLAIAQAEDDTATMMTLGRQLADLNSQF
jgi:tetratricopeptide (TPR) repeat protein